MLAILVGGHWATVAPGNTLHRRDFRDIKARLFFLKYDLTMLPMLALNS
jgi:hypothetical protein